MRSKGAKPTREERRIIANAGLDTYEWLVQKHTSTVMTIINKNTGEIKEIEL